MQYKNDKQVKSTIMMFWLIQRQPLMLDSLHQGKRFTPSHTSEWTANNSNNEFNKNYSTFWSQKFDDRLDNENSGRSDVFIIACYNKEKRMLTQTWTVGSKWYL